MKRRSRLVNKLEVGFGEEIHRLRRQRRLTIERTAEETGVSRTLISDAERNCYAPTADTVRILAEHLAPAGQVDSLIALAGETYGRLEFPVDGLDRERIEVLVQLGRRLKDVPPAGLKTIRSVLASVA